MYCDGSDHSAGTARLLSRGSGASLGPAPRTSGDFGNRPSYRNQRVNFLGEAARQHREISLYADLSSPQASSVRSAECPVHDGRSPRLADSLRSSSASPSLFLPPTGQKSTHRKTHRILPSTWDS